VEEKASLWYVLLVILTNQPLISAIFHFFCDGKFLTNVSVHGVQVH